MHSYGHIIVRPLTSAFDFAYTRPSFDWAESFDKLKRALACSPFMNLIWGTPPVFNYFHFYGDSALMFDKPLRALAGFC